MQRWAPQLEWSVVANFFTLRLRYFLTDSCFKPAPKFHNNTPLRNTLRQKYGSTKNSNQSLCCLTVRDKPSLITSLLFFVSLLSFFFLKLYFNFHENKKHDCEVP